MLEIHFDLPGLEHQATPGYYIRLESVSDKHGAGGMGGHMNLGGAGGHQMGVTGVGVIAKVNKMMKQAAFQFSYDPINKRFSRELRDKENKDIMIDRNYLQLKVLKEQWQAKL